MNFKADKNSPFSNKTYIKMFFAQIISLVGTGITTIALALLAWKIAGSDAGEVLGIALALKMVAYVVLSPIISTFADKFDRRKWLIFLDISRAFLVLCLPFITQIWHIYVLLFLINAFASGFTPIYQATLSQIIDEEKAYQKALSYSRLAYDLEQLLSPSLAAVLLTFMSFSGLFVLDCITFILSAMLLLFCIFPKGKQTISNENFLQNLKFGISAYFKTPRLRAMFAIYIVIASVSAMMITNTVVYVNGYLKMDDTHTAIAFGIAGFGSMMVALFLPKILEKIKISLSLFLGAILAIIGLFASSYMPNWWGFLLCWFILGVGLSLMSVPSGMIVRMSCRKEDSINYFSANFSLSHFCWLIMYPLSGFLGVKFGLSITFIIFAIIAFVALIFAYKIYPSPDNIELEHTHKKIVHEHFFIDDGLHDFNDTIEKHTHKKLTHKHKFVIDLHHDRWPV